MNSSSPPRKAFSVAVVALVGIVLLVAGLGLGYFLGRPSAAPAPGPVDELSRANTIPRVDGWFRNASVTYLDYGPQPNIAIPILAFFQAASPDTPVSGQRNIIDSLPGQPGYSDFWRVYKVLTPSAYAPNTIRSLADAVASGYPIEATNIVVNCPVVNPNATIAGSSTTPTRGWYRGQEVSYFDHGGRSATDGDIVLDAPIYAFFHADGSPVAGQKNVIDVLPGMSGYSDLWRVVKVVVGSTYAADTLKDARSILAASEAGEVTLELTTIRVNCPVVS